MVSKNQLFLDLAKPDEYGISRWVNVSEFVNEYSRLVFGNGADWARSDRTLAKSYIIEFDKTVTAGNRIDRVRLNGINKKETGTQQIRNDIRQIIIKQNCIVLGTSHKTNKEIEVDHKNGRKNDLRVMNLATQELSDFQPLSKAANDAKRQACKICRRTDIRFDATKLGYNYSVITGELQYSHEVGCLGCFWYDPVEFRKKLFKKP